MNARGRTSARTHRVCGLALAALLAGCAPRTSTITLPQGNGQPLDAPSVATLAATLAEPCRDVQALTADVRIAGRVDGEKVRGTLQVGVDRSAVRIEGVPPFGAPVFVLAGRSDSATLLFPRDEVFVRDASVAALTEAIVGVALAPADLLALLAGCGLSPRDTVRGASFGGGWTRLDMRDGAAVWARTKGSPSGPGEGVEILVAETGAWRVDYEPRRPAQALRGTLRRRQGEATRLSFVVEAPDHLAALPAGALEITIPVKARPIPVEQLRRQRALSES